MYPRHPVDGFELPLNTQNTHKTFDRDEGARIRVVSLVEYAFGDLPIFASLSSSLTAREH